MTTSSVPDTSPRLSSVPSTERPRSSVPSTSAPNASVPSTVMPKKDTTATRAPRSRSSHDANKRHFKGQRIGVRQWDGTLRELTDERQLALAIVPGPGTKQRLLDRTPWSGLEIVEMD